MLVTEVRQPFVGRRRLSRKGIAWLGCNLQAAILGGRENNTGHPGSRDRVRVRLRAQVLRIQCLSAEGSGCPSCSGED